MGVEVKPLFWIAAATGLLIVLLPAAAAADGNGRIAFASNGRISSVDPAGGAEADLGPGTAPAWSPDGGRLAFLDGGTSVMNADGSGRRLLHTGNDRRPVWSPDGTRLAFVTDTGGTGALAVLDVASGATRVVVPAGVQLSWPPSWSPDGTQLAYTEGAAVDLALVGADGSGHRTLSGGTGLDAGPAWSPDGGQIAYLHAPPGELAAVYLVAPGGGPPRRLTGTYASPTGVAATSPAWSPDSTRVAFTASHTIAYTRVGPIVSNEVHVIDADGTVEHRLTRADAAPGFELPTWSPDGRRILFQSGGTAFLMNADGTCENRVTERPAQSPTWQPLPGVPPVPQLRCADLELTVSQERGSMAADGEETFRVAVKNLENEPATGVRLEAPAPQGGSLVAASTDRGSCTLDGGALACSLGELPVGYGALVTVLVRGSAVGVVSTTARTTANEPDGDQANNVGRLAVTVLLCTFVARDAGDRLVGTPGADSMCGRAGQDAIYGLAGNDVIDAGLGADRVFPGPGRDIVHLRAGADFVDARDDRRDTIDCGGERDLVLADSVDVVNRDCEAVAGPQIARCKTIGTMRSDELITGRGADSVCALAGNDEIHTLRGDDAVDAGGGNDTLDGGPGRDLLLGGEGYDTIFARDGQRDRVRCGPQYDIVLADTRDLVATNCELVRRRGR